MSSCLWITLRLLSDGPAASYVHIWYIFFFILGCLSASGYDLKPNNSLAAAAPGNGTWRKNKTGAKAEEYVDCRLWSSERERGSWWAAAALHTLEYILLGRWRTRTETVVEDAAGSGRQRSSWVEKRGVYNKNDDRIRAIRHVEFEKIGKILPHLFGSQQHCCKGVQRRKAYAASPERTINILIMWCMHISYQTKL